MNTLVDGPQFKKLYEILDRVNFDSLSEGDNKNLLQVATKSDQIRDIVPLHNMWEEMMSWPGILKKKFSGVDGRVDAQIDLVEARFRSEASRELFTKARDITANCTAVQALLKSHRGVKGLETRQGPCKAASDRADEWNVTLRSSLSSALKRVQGAARGGSAGK